MSAQKAIASDPFCRERDAGLNVRVKFIVRSIRLRISQYELFCWTIIVMYSKVMLTDDL
jgi:hypothetical protein